MRVVLLVALVLAAAYALLGQPRLVGAVRAGQWEPEWLLLAPFLFLVFTLLAVVDAVRGARRRGFVSGRSLLQVGFALAVLAMLTPSTWYEYQSRKAPPGASEAMMEALSRSRDARVRALVVELAGTRLRSPQMRRLVEKGLDDADPMVRDSALRTLAEAEGISLEGEDGLEQARERLRRQRDAVLEGSPAR